MRRQSITKLALVLVSLSAGSAFAYKPVKDFSARSAPTAEEIAESKARSKSNVNDFNQDLAADEEPVPWMEIGMAIIVFAVAAPFGWRAYKSTASEIADSRAANNARASRASDDA